MRKSVSHTGQPQECQRPQMAGSAHFEDFNIDRRMRILIEYIHEIPLKYESQRKGSSAELRIEHKVDYACFKTII